MSIQAKLIIDEKELNLLHFNFSFSQTANDIGRPSGQPTFNGLIATIESQKDSNVAEWSISKGETKQIEIHIFPRVLGGRIRKIFLYDCHLVNWNNVFYSSGSQPLSETLKITCGGIKTSYSTTEFSTYWRETFSDDTTAATQLEHEEEEPEILSCRYLDMDGNPIEELYEDEVILEIETKNCVGKLVDIDLSDDEFDFKYKGKVLVNDLLEGLKITADTQEVKLEVVEE